jgi:hypothetical protein
MELTNGKPKLKAGQMIVDDPKLGVGNVKGNGGHLHCAREDWGPESASFEVMQGEIRANDFIVFICALSRSLYHVSSHSQSLPRFCFTFEVVAFSTCPCGPDLTDVHDGDGGLAVSSTKHQHLQFRTILVHPRADVVASEYMI